MVSAHALTCLSYRLLSRGEERAEVTLTKFSVCAPSTQRLLVRFGSLVSFRLFSSHSSSFRLLLFICIYFFFIVDAIPSGGLPDCRRKVVPGYGC